jgi:hypothetical protein
VHRSNVNDIEIDLGVDPYDVIGALLESKEYRENMHKRILRVVFRVEKSTSGKSLKNMFYECDR